MEIALFGGSFNPPHRGHAEVLRYLHELHDAAGKPRFAEIWLVPVFDHPFGKCLLPFATRIDLCQALIRDLGKAGKRIRVSTVEGDLGGESFTVKTLKHLRDKHPGKHFTLVLGSDLKADLPRWKNAAELEKLATIEWIARQGFDQENQALGLNPVAPEVSSTELRLALEKNAALGTWLTPSVAEEIQRRGLYRTAGEQP